MFDFNNVKEVRLSSGSHKSPEQGMCFMEMAAWFAGEEHSDKPECVSPSLGELGIHLNDAMPDNLRDESLKPMIPHVVGTADKANETARIEYICLRAFNYAGGFVLGDFARRGPARSFGEAQHMARYIEAGGRYRDYNYGSNPNSQMGMMGSPLAGAREHEELGILLCKMLRRHAPSLDFFEPLGSAATPIKDVLYSHPNETNAKIAAGVFAYVAQRIIPDYSAALDTLREAIKLGRHDGFDISVNLETRHEKLRELVTA